MSQVHVKGLAELQKFLDTLPEKLQKNVMRGALRAGMKPIQADAKANVAVASGLLQRGLKISTKSKGGRVTASLKSTGKHGYLANWIEYGTAAHRISGKGGGLLSFAGIFTRFVDHPGAKAHAFMRPALDARASDAVVATAEYIKKRLSTREGLNTSAVEILGE